MGENFQRPAAKVIRYEFFQSHGWWWFNVLGLIIVPGREDKESVILRSRRYKSAQDCLHDIELCRGKNSEIAIVRIGATP